MKFKILVADKISEKGVASLQENPEFDVLIKHGMNEEELISVIPEFDAILIRSATKVTEKVIEAGTKLKAVGRAGVGIDNVNVDKATERGIVVMNTPGGNTISTAEHAFSLLLSMARNIPQADASMKASRWDRKLFQGVEVCGKTLGVIGMGRIGTEVAKRAIGFSMKVLAYDPYLSASRAKALQVEVCEDISSLLSRSDFITLHVPSTEDTRHILNGERLSQCKKGVRIINCARGDLMVEADMAAALESGQVASLALDVYEKEPPSEDFSLRKFKNVVLTPHLGASTSEAQENVGIEVAEIVEGYLSKGIVRNAVNMPSVDVHLLETLRPYILAGERMGRFIGQLAPKRLEKLNVNYSGKLCDQDTMPITRSILKGLLMHIVGSSVNEVNAPIFAKNQGILFDETKASKEEHFTDLIRVEASSGDCSAHISVAFFGNSPRLVNVNGKNIEAMLEGTLCVLENLDQPGIVGWIGTTLAKHKINIANMSLARKNVGSQALSILTLDSVPNEDAMKEIASNPDIFSAKIITL